MDQQLAKIEGTDEWWFARLFGEFFKRERRRNEKYRTRVEWAEYLWKWYLGDPELPIHAEGWQSQVTKDVLRMGRANLAMLAVESKLDRIQLLSFRTSTEEDDDDPDGAEAACRKMIRKYGTAFDDALLYASVMNDGYLWIGTPGADGLPTVTAEDPRQCITIDDPLDETVAVAALKMYRDDVLKMDYAHVVLPARDAIYGEQVVDEETGERAVISSKAGYRIAVASRKSTSAGVSTSWTAGGGWEWDTEKSKEYPEQAQGRGTLVHHVKAPNGIGDIEPVIDLLERINNMIVDRLWISKFQAFRQRAMQEKDSNNADERPDPMPENDPETGLPIDWDSILSADPGAVWRLPIGMTIWESTPTDLQGALLAVRDDIKEFAAVTRTPVYVFTPDAVSGSATGASLAREGQVFKAEKWIKRHSPVFLAVCADMLAVAGFAEAAKAELELKWGPAERVTMSERAASGVQARTAGVPLEGVWEDYMQASPETMIRYRALAKKEQSAALLAQTPPAPAPTVRPADQPTPVPPPARDAVDDLITPDGRLAAAV